MLEQVGLNFEDQSECNSNCRSRRQAHILLTLEQRRLLGIPLKPLNTSVAKYNNVTETSQKAQRRMPIPCYLM